MISCRNQIIPEKKKNLAYLLWTPFFLLDPVLHSCMKVRNKIPKHKRMKGG